MFPGFKKFTGVFDFIANIIIRNFNRELDLFELNEAFSSQSMAVIDELGLEPAKVNLDGGAIAIGHPLGASGARITGKAASLLSRTGSNRAIATMCIGGGMGIAIALESL